METETQLRCNVDLIINGGRRVGSIASTIVECTDKMPLILREGLMNSKAIREALTKYSQRSEK